MTEFVWLNDGLLPMDQARISVNDRGFLYGDGFFETLRAEAGSIWFLKEHLTRLQNSAAAFRLPFPQGLPWEERLGRLLTANGLEQATARVKILLTRGEAPGLGLHKNLDLNVAIRTAIISQGQAHFAVGGGVVYDSREEDEFEETLHKAGTLFRVIAGEL